MTIPPHGPQGADLADARTPSHRWGIRHLILGASLLSLILAGLTSVLVLTGQIGGVARPADWPPVAADQAETRLLPVVIADGEGVYTWQRLDSTGQPIRYDPCQPIHWVYNPAGQIPAGERLIADAVEEISARTGLVFVYDGHTTETWTKPRGFTLDRYGDRWAPVLIAWGEEATTPVLTGDVAGAAGSASVGLNRSEQALVTGQVVFDREQLLLAQARPDQQGQAYGVMLHELAHLVGLGHVADPTQLMYHAALPDVTTFAAGDLQGLAEAGNGPCHPHS